MREQGQDSNWILFLSENFKVNFKVGYTKDLCCYIFAVVADITTLLRYVMYVCW